MPDVRVKVDLMTKNDYYNWDEDKIMICYNLITYVVRHDSKLMDEMIYLIHELLL